MSIFTNTILEVVYSNLIGNSELMDLVNDAVFDHVPQTQDYPYVNIGELVETEDNTDDQEQGVQASITIHSYSRKQGRKETGDIQEQINKSLHRADLIASGFNFVTIDHVQSQSFTDADGRTRHGIVEFNIIIKEV